MEAADGEERNVHGVRWRDVCAGQHAAVDAGGSSGLLGVVGEEVRSAAAACARCCLLLPAQWLLLLLMHDACCRYCC